MNLRFDVLQKGFGDLTACISSWVGGPLAIKSAMGFKG